MSRTDWPKLCTIADAARLFEKEGRKVHRSNLSRFIDSRGIVKTDGKVDPTALFAAFTNDYGREVMAGRTGGAIDPQPPAAPAPFQPPAAPVADPKRDLARVNAQIAQLDLDERLNKTLPVEEVSAALATALAELHAAGLRIARDHATRLLADLGAPGHKSGAAVAGLKRYAVAMQEAFAASAAKLMDASSGKDVSGRARLDALVALDLQLRGETEPEGEGADAPSPALEPEPS